MSNPPVFYFVVNCKCWGVRHMPNPHVFYFVVKFKCGRVRHRNCIERAWEPSREQNVFQFNKPLPHGKILKN
jgi:hypothetical protein